MSYQPLNDDDSDDQLVPDDNVPLLSQQSGPSQMIPPTNAAFTQQPQTAPSTSQPLPQGHTQQPQPMPQGHTQQPPPVPQGHTQQPQPLPQGHTQQPQQLPQGYTQQPQPLPQGHTQQSQPLPQGNIQQPQPLPQGHTQQPQPLPQGYTQPPHQLPQGYTQQPQPLPQGHTQQPQPLPQGHTQQPQPLPQGHIQPTHLGEYQPCPPVMGQQNITSNQVVLSQPTNQPAVTVLREKAPEYLIFSIILMVVCTLVCPLVCLPLNIPALIFSIKANNHNGEGKYEDARQSGRISLVLNMISLFIGIGFWAAYIVLGAIIAIVNSTQHY